MISSMLRTRARAGRFYLSRASIRRSLLLVPIVLAVLASTAGAANRFWVPTGGGIFGSSSWSATTSAGPSGATAPGAADLAIFAHTTSSIYTVSFDANATNTGFLINNDNVTFDLNGKTYIATGGANIGNVGAQIGRLTVKYGTVDVDTDTDQILVGATSSTGFLTVSTGGRIGDGTIDPNLIIGDGGAGTLMIEDNGVANLGYLSIGQTAQKSTGSATVSGPNASLNTISGILVGRVGTGTLNVQNSGTVTSAGASTLGVSLGANGTVNVSGIGSTFNQVGALVVADLGNAALNVQSAGVLNTSSAVTIGKSSTGVGTGIVTGTDSIWTMASTLQIGVDGLGNFAVTSGGRASTVGAVQMSVNALSKSNAIITGAGARWSTGAMTVGNLGSANLTVSDGAVIDTNGNATIAAGAAAVGNVIVRGADSKWSVAGALNIASLGTATMTVENDASVSTTGALTIGDPPGSQLGTLNFNGGTISAGGFTRTGASQFNWTNGTLLLTGGTLNNGGANLTINGSGLNDLPALRLGGGSQSLAANLPNLTVGNNRQGAVVVSGGSTFQTTTAVFGNVDGGTGSLVVEGQNSVFSTTGDLGLGGSTTAAGGLGTVTIGPGGTLTAGNTLRLWGGGTINLVGGTLRFNSLAANGGKAVFNSGTVQVLSAFNANAAALDALLGPTHTLGVGRKIETLGNTMNLQSNLTATGGAIAGNFLSVSADVIARFEGAATGIFSNGIANPLGARMYVTDSTVAAGTTFTNGGELHLAGSTATVNATSITNTGLVDGSGRVNSVVTNNSAGQIRVAAGQRLEILGASGTSINNGLIDVDGGAIEFGRSITNSSVSPSSGMIAARDATLRFQSGLLNSGALTFSGGVSDVFGKVTNQNNLATQGRIVVTGGAQANFFDDVVNSGSIQVSAAGSLQSTAVFLGSLSGNGVAGGGHVFLEGDTRPGFSPGTMAFGGDVSFGPLSSLDVELAGTTPGTQYDRVTVAATAAIGGELNVSLLNNFKPTIGNSFQVVSAAGGLAGTFANVDLPALAGGASWSVDYGAGAITLSVGGVLGDFNLDGRVDTADYTVWRNQLGTNSLAADASGNGSVDQADYNIWKSNFGQVAATGGASGGLQAAAVPEPTTAVILFGIAVFAASSGLRCNRRIPPVG